MRQLIAQYRGGSHMYGLATPESDVDLRGIYVTEDLSALFGFKEDNSMVLIDTDGNDVAYFELRHYLQILRKTNSQAVELLYNTEWLIDSPILQRLLDNRRNLVDGQRLYTSLRAYMLHEQDIAFGRSKNAQHPLGARRKEDVEKHGYSSRNAVHCIRLAYCGSEFFSTGIFPVNVARSNPELAKKLLCIKQDPGSVPIAVVEELSRSWFDTFEMNYHSVPVEQHTAFHTDIANSIMLEAYSKLFQ